VGMILYIHTYRRSDPLLSPLCQRRASEGFAPMPVRYGVNDFYFLDPESAANAGQASSG